MRTRGESLKLSWGGLDETLGKKYSPKVVEPPSLEGFKRCVDVTLTCGLGSAGLMVGL